MIDYTEVRQKIETYLIDNFTSLPVIAENTRQLPFNEPHIELIDYDTTSAPMETGSSVQLVDGNLVVRILSMKGRGTETARKAASELNTLLLNLSSNNINFFEPVFTTVGEIDNSPLYEHQLMFRLQYFYGQVDQLC